MLPPSQMVLLLWIETSLFASLNIHESRFLFQLLTLFCILFPFLGRWGRFWQFPWGEPGLNTRRRNLFIIYSFLLRRSKGLVGRIIHKGFMAVTILLLLLMMTLLLLLMLMMTMMTMMMMMMMFSDDRSPSHANRVSLRNTNSVNLGYSNRTNYICRRKL